MRITKIAVILLFSGTTATSCQNVDSNHSEDPEIKEDSLLTQNKEVPDFDDCSNLITFDYNKICLPKFNGWVECRHDPKFEEYVDNIEQVITPSVTMIACYFPEKVYADFREKQKTNSVIYWYAINKTIGVKMGYFDLDKVYTDVNLIYKTSIPIDDKDKLIRSKKGVVLRKPILLDNYESAKSAKTSVTLVSNKNSNGEIVQMISFTNLLLLNQRLYHFIFFSKVKNGFKYSEVKEQNQEFIDNIYISN